MNCRRRRVLRSLLISLSQFVLEELLEMAENKRIWTRNWISRRNQYGASALLLKELRNEDCIEYRSVLRLTPNDFDYLLSIISPNIQKEDTVMRDAIPAQIKLETTLSYLATGNSFKNLSHFYRISNSAISRFVPEVCEEISKALKQYFKFPEEDREWQEIERGFRDRWNFPTCYGAIDGKHIIIKAPPHSGSNYFSYKKTFSIILLAIVDHDYCFTYADVGANGSASDGNVFRNSSVFQQLENGLLPNDGVIVADAAFPLKTYIMKPYPGDNLDYEQKIFNYRLSRARRIVENAFGILASRFRIFYKPIAIDVNNVARIVMAAVSMHNWLRKMSANNYLTTNNIDREDIESGSIIPGSWRSDNASLSGINRQGSNNPSFGAIQKRDTYKNYFANEGAVSWQNRMIH